MPTERTSCLVIRLCTSWSCSLMQRGLPLSLFKPLPSPFEPAMAFSFPRVRVLVGAAVHYLGTVFPVIKLASVSEFVEWISIVLISFALYCIHGQNIPARFRSFTLIIGDHHFCMLYQHCNWWLRFVNRWHWWIDEFPFIWLAQVRKEIQETWCPAQSRRI